RRPPAGHETEVDPVHAAVENVHDEQVAEHEDDQREAGDPHEQPAVKLEVAPPGRGPARRARLGECEISHQCPPPNRMDAVRHSIATAPGIITANQITTIVHNIGFWYFTPLAQKSTSITRMPLSAW